ncbi:hypothetical protein TCAL_04515 [Tigriopus californicus]|uniref:Dynein regulatory complex protein 1/2 N-terminal domain-containing protein n=1 Tax=Tigriopus californicus TaxID=6832 RepID=A0A553PB38_TIGCA|nr:dynein regulatory complex protein 1-like [Tigriopus californicus]TRY74892.1 hypothetical protein TCAL_04515 [Tigriopus californicus]
MPDRNKLLITRIPGTLLLSPNEKMASKGLPDEVRLWDIDHANLQDRIEARRERISKRISAAKRLTQMIKVQNIFGSGLPNYDEDLEPAGNYVQFQKAKTEKLTNELLSNGCEMMDNVRLAADRLQIQHRDRVERRDQVIKQIMEQDIADTELEFEQIQQRWPDTDVAKNAPTDLFTKIMEQKQACNALLEKRNDLIAGLEDELQDSDDQYQVLIEEYHENISVLAARMEQLLQTFENMARSENIKLEEAFEREINEKRAEQDEEWQKDLDQVKTYSIETMEQRLATLQSNEEELDRTILEDAEAFTIIKHDLEDKVNLLSDQVQLICSVNSLNEERLDYEIHVLRKHEEEIGLVKADQKRKITSLQDTINKLKVRVAEVQKKTIKGEEALHEKIGDIKKQLQKLERMSRMNSMVTLRKQNDLVNMARDNSLEKIKHIVESDQQLQSLYTANGTLRVKLYLEPLFNIRSSMSSSNAQRIRPKTANLERRNRPSSDSHGLQLRRRSPSQEQSFVSDRRSSKDLLDMKTALSNLVHEASFLVEENLNLLVEADDVTPDEKNLFKLDSILNTIGVQGEDEVLDVIQSFEKNPTVSMKDNVLKVIRKHIEQSKRTSDLRVSPLTPGSLSSSRGSSARRVAHLYDNLPDMIRDWTKMRESFNEFQSSERSEMIKSLNQDYKVVLKIEQLDKEQVKLDRQVRELADIARKFGYYGDLEFSGC